MEKPEKEKKTEDITLTDKKVASTKEETTNTVNETPSYTTDALMPELEELVKKNPNRLIGCGG